MDPLWLMDSQNINNTLFHGYSDDYYHNTNNNISGIDTNTYTNNNNNLTEDQLLRLIQERIKQLQERPATAGQLIHDTIVIFCYTIIILLSLVGNLLVVKVILFGKPKMLTTTNLLIASLAVSDLVMTGFNIPFNVARLLLQSWPFGSFMCVSVPFVQVTCVYVSTFTMTVIAFHRWWTVRRREAPAAGGKSLTKLQLTITIGTTWLLAALLAVPHSMFNETLAMPTIRIVRCEVHYPKLAIDWWSTPSSPEPITISLPLWLSVEAFTTQYLIPLGITIWLYYRIGRVIAAQGRLAGQSTDQRKRQQSDARKRRIAMLILVVTVFAICWLPLNLYHLLVDFELISRHYNIFLVCHWFAMSSVCYNPFIYCYLNSSFKNGAKKFYQFILCQKSSVAQQQQQPLQQRPSMTTNNTIINNNNNTVFQHQNTIDNNHQELITTTTTPTPVTTGAL
ncbi:G-protein coupled receptor 83-like [Oppia nitens]|uniref:G-protein coupled receptor 83-like n=1 Tax=Oppia nitens TaxID=1686743 RepID=UPI0023DCD138|nr:G-protein coupled receptor 83-like [Oppia nitens]